MWTVQSEGESLGHKKDQLADEQIGFLANAFICKFIEVIRAYTFFHLLFLLLGILQLFSFIYFFKFFKESSLIAFSLSLLFLTTFSYFILRLYYHARKPEQFKELKSQFIEEAQEIIAYQDGDPHSHALMGDVCCRLAQGLEGLEHNFYLAPKILSWFFSFFEKISCWAHWHDVFNMREIILIEVVEEQTKLVKCEATSLEAHTALANAYILLSGLYMPSHLQEEDNEKWWKPSKIHSEELFHKFKMAAERAIEEFKILCYYAPNDPWVHEQLAYSYCELKMPLEAIVEYEAMIKLNPKDAETLYKLGTLYFQLGQNARGLQVYEQLKNAHYKKAEMLISHYGHTSQT